MSFFVYVLKSSVDERLYKGHTQNIEKRIKEHNAGKTFSTKKYIPWTLVYFEEFDTRDDAILRERYFKSGVGREFLAKKIPK